VIYWGEDAPADAIKVGAPVKTARGQNMQGGAPAMPRTAWVPAAWAHDGRRDTIGSSLLAHWQSLYSSAAPRQTSANSFKTCT
jgi:hypothetical protein